MGRRTLGERSFQYIGPVIWNSLPVSVVSGIRLHSLKSKWKSPSLLFCVLICSFPSSHSTNPSPVMHVFVCVQNCQPLCSGRSLLYPRAQHYAHDYITTLSLRKTNKFFFRSHACVWASNSPATGCACAFFVSEMLAVPQPIGIRVLTN